jgi:hypothetical protein
VASLLKTGGGGGRGARDEMDPCQVESRLASGLRCMGECDPPFRFGLAWIKLGGQVAMRCRRCENNGRRKPTTMTTTTTTATTPMTARARTTRSTWAWALRYAAPACTNSNYNQANPQLTRPGEDKPRHAGMRRVLVVRRGVVSCQCRFATECREPPTGR